MVSVVVVFYSYDAQLPYIYIQFVIFNCNFTRNDCSFLFFFKYIILIIICSIVFLSGSFVIVCILAFHEGMHQSSVFFFLAIPQGFFANTDAQFEILTNQTILSIATLRLL